ncbi:response regulator [Leptolyngbya sp. AN03gr2]|uniref:response regulator n=1 Tax=unclassified Leptolyngbya TaxID=2650499 RepID=UPI003D3194B3
MKILIVEDNEIFAKNLRELLTAQNYCIDLAEDGEVAWDFLQASEYDLILLDLRLPKLDGIQFCQRLRKSAKNVIPVLILTADGTSKLQGLNAGADDYLVKPIAIEELLVRIKVLLRRGRLPMPILTWGKLVLDPNVCEFTYDEIPLSLSRKEYSLLELFVRNQQRIFSHQALMEHLWSIDETPTENAVRAQIKSVRQKLRKVGIDEFIETIYGFGYRLKIQALETAKELIEPEFSFAWQEHSQKYLDRVAILEQAVDAIESKTLSPDLEQQAFREVHTLIGSLGSFGIDTGSALSSQIEQQLKTICTEGDRTKIPMLRQKVAALKTTLLKTTIDPSPPLEVHTGENLVARLLIVDDDVALIEQLTTVSQRFCCDPWTIQAEGATSVAEAREILRTRSPDVILLDLSFPDEDGFSLLTELSENQPEIPVIVFTASDAFSDRIRVARLGGRSFLQKPISSSQVMGNVCHVLQQLNQIQTTLMIVDDDPQVLDFLRTILQPWGFHLTLVDQSEQVWHLLEQVNPDLLILNIEMPTVNGIELCQVIRNDRRWDALPILFLSAHSDEQTIAQVFSAGADDYVRKPIVESELVARVLNRLERVQLLRQCVAQAAR